MTADINNLVSAEASILTLTEYVNKNGLIPDQLMWDAPKLEIKCIRKGTTESETVKVFVIYYCKEKI